MHCVIIKMVRVQEMFLLLREQFSFSFSLIIAYFSTYSGIFLICHKLSYSYRFNMLKLFENRLCFISPGFFLVNKNRTRITNCRRTVTCWSWAGRRRGSLCTAGCCPWVPASATSSPPSTGPASASLRASDSLPVGVSFFLLISYTPISPLSVGWTFINVFFL